MTKIGVSISCYDKFDELIMLVEMIRSWKGEYKIGLCCNHPDGERYKHLVDYYIQGRDIPFVESSTREKTFFFNQDDNYAIRVRAADCVRESCWLMTEYSDCDWVIHVHADAWFLSEDGVKKFVSDCERHACHVACRGTGIDSAMNPFCSTSAYGQADDHFFAFYVPAARTANAWSYRPEDLLMRKYSVHGILMTIFAVKFGLRHVWYYKKLTDTLNYASKPSIDNETKPCVYDKEYGFLHIHRGSLPELVGEALQAHFIMRYCDIENLPHMWKMFVCEYSQENIISNIRGYDEELNKILKKALFPKKILNKTRITYKESLIDNMTVATPIKNISKRLKAYIYYKLFPHVDIVSRYNELNEKIDDDSWDRVWKND